MHDMTSYAICYGGEPRDNKEINVHGFFDFDWDGDIDRRWSTSGYMFKIFCRVVSMLSRRNLVVILLTIEVE